MGPVSQNEWRKSRYEDGWIWVVATQLSKLSSRRIGAGVDEGGGGGWVVSVGNGTGDGDGDGGCRVGEAQ